MGWPSGDEELRKHLEERHKFSRGVRSPLSFHNGEKRPYNEGELKSKHSELHGSMAISTPQRIEEGKHHQ